MEAFQRLIMLSMLLPTVPPVLQKRIVRLMIKDCDLGLSLEEIKEFEEMYDSSKEFVVTGLVQKILDHAILKLQTGRVDEAIKIIGDFRSNLQINIRCLSLKDTSQKIKEYVDKLEKE